MKSLKDSILESLLNESDKIAELEKKLDKVEKKADDAKKDAKKAEKEANKAEESIKSEKDFRDYAENKFKEVFGDDLDEDKMNKVVDGILNDNKEMVDEDDWGSLVGILNKSFGS